MSEAPLHFIRFLPAIGALEEGPAYHPTYGAGIVERQLWSSNNPDYFFRIVRGMTSRLMPAGIMADVLKATPWLCAENICEGSKVWWDDPAGVNAGFYQVKEILPPQNGYGIIEVAVTGDGQQHIVLLQHLVRLIGIIHEWKPWMTDGLPIAYNGYIWASQHYMLNISEEDDRILLNCPTCGGFE